MTESDLRLILQTALLGEVGGALRGVGCGIEDRTVRVRFWFDGPVSPEDRESASCVVTELYASLPHDWRIADEVVRLDAPAPLPSEPRMVFRRRE
jgi:hypothetical protein